MNYDSEARVWIKGAVKKRTTKAVHIMALDKTARLRSVVIPRANLLEELKVEGSEEFKFKVPKWVAHVNKLEFTEAVPGQYHVTLFNLSKE